MKDHIDKRRLVRSIGDVRDIEDAIERCNLRPDYKTLLRILYIDGGCLDDVCDAVGREYTTVSKWHRAALVKLCYILQKQGKI